VACQVDVLAANSRYLGSVVMSVHISPKLLSLSNKNIVLGITGGIAAYKCAELVRDFKRLGAQVRVVMSAAAQEFVSPLTLQALSGNPVHTSILDPEAEAGMGHIELARWADMLLIAPATANFISRLAAGEGSDLLTTLCLATNAHIMVAPAMNQQMWNNSATQDNIALLRRRAIQIAGPAEGEQACGDVGPGRLLDLGTLLSKVAAGFNCGCLAGKKVVVTAGPTREALDPVRYISNQSSGKMGYALARAAVDAGANVMLISGPVQLAVPEHVSVIAVESAMEMYEAVMVEASSADIVIAAAAVADYRPKQMSEQKIKKSGSDTMTLELVKNPDIVASVAALPGKRCIMGFAAETENLEKYAREKLARKKLHAIVANDISVKGIGFNSDDNAAVLYAADNSVEHYSRRSKAQLARDLIGWLGRQ